MSNSYENDYISILLNINKRLRDQVEKLYALLKCKVEIDYSSNDKSRIKSVLSDLEIISSNLSLHMEEQASLIEVVKQIDNKHKELIKQNDLINHQVQSIESLSNDNLLLTNENVELKKNNSLLLSQIETMKNENITIKDENTKLIQELDKKKENELNSEDMLNKIEMLSKQLSGVEGKYKAKLVQKDIIISKLDEQLQTYENEIKEKELKLLQFENELNTIKKETIKSNEEIEEEEEEDEMNKYIKEYSPNRKKSI